MGSHCQRGRGLPVVPASIRPKSRFFRRFLQRVAKKEPRALEDELSNVREMFSEMNSQPVRQEVG